MIVSEIFDFKIDKDLTKKEVEKILNKKNIKPVKWAIVSALQKNIKILVSFEKKTL